MAREQWTVYAFLCDGDNGNCVEISDSHDEPLTVKLMAEDKGWYIDADGERDAMALCPKHRHEYDDPPTTLVIEGDDLYSGYHVGRSWSGHELEDDCSCVKAPCGLVAERSPECPQHAPKAAKTIRQSHPEHLCPALLEEAREAVLLRNLQEETSAGGAPGHDGEPGDVPSRIEAPTPGAATPPAEPVLSSCPNCGDVTLRTPYDIGSGPELCCANCDWCWGVDGQELTPLVAPGVFATQRALAAHREGREVSLNHETGEWTVDGEVIRTRPFKEPSDDLGRRLAEERTGVVARILEIERLPPDPDRKAEWQKLNIRLSEIDKTFHP